MITDFESLETRRLFSGIAFNPDENSVIVTGSMSADTISVAPAQSNQIALTLNAITQLVPASDFLSIVVDSSAGDDSITIDGSIGIGVQLNAGDGNDSLKMIGRDVVHDEIDVSGYAIHVNGRVTNLESVESIEITSLGGPDLISFFGLSQPTSLRAARILAGDGDDQIQFFDEQSLGGASIDIRGEAGNDLLIWGDANSPIGRSHLVTAGLISIGDLGAIRHDAATERIILIGGIGPDVFRVRPSATTSYTIDGGGFSSTAARDALLVQRAGSIGQSLQFTSSSSGSVTAANAKPIAFTQMESAQLVFVVGSPPFGEKVHIARRADELLA